MELLHFGRQAWNLKRTLGRFLSSFKNLFLGAMFMAECKRRSSPVKLNLGSMIWAQASGHRGSAAMNEAAMAEAHQGSEVSQGPRLCSAVPEFGLLNLVWCIP